MTEAEMLADVTQQHDAGSQIDTRSWCTATGFGPILRLEDDALERYMHFRIRAGRSLNRALF